MAFSILSSAHLSFANPPGPITGNGMTCRAGTVSVQNLQKVGGPAVGPVVLAAYDKLLANLENLILAQQVPEEAKRMRLNNPLNCTMIARLYYGAITPASAPRKLTGYIDIGDADDCNGPLNRLGQVCGGLKNLKADLELELGTKDDRMKLSFQGLNWIKDLNNQDVSKLGKYFNFTHTLALKWASTAKFSGTISINLKLSDEAFHLVYLGTLSDGGSVNKRLLEDARSSGDVIIIASNGKSVPCHKIFLTAQSDQLKVMTQSGSKKACSKKVEMPDMTESGVRALLAYLYCRDIKQAVASDYTALELLLAADKYKIDQLLETMKDLILVKDSEWLSVASALKLIRLGKTKPGDPVCKALEEKAVSVLKSKSMLELKQCAEFRELFNNPDSAIEMCFFFMQK